VTAIECAQASRDVSRRNSWDPSPDLTSRAVASVGGLPVADSQLQVRRVVLTWLSTSTGGAERSVADLAMELRRFGVDARVVWWSYSPDTHPPASAPSAHTTVVESATGYRGAVANALHGAAGDTVVISNHRTALIDHEIAGTFKVPVAAVLRALLVPSQRMRFIAHAEDSGLSPQLPTELEWKQWGAVDTWVGISRAASNSIRRYLTTGGQVETIYNGVATVAPCVEALVPRVPRRFLTLSRLEPWKNVELVLRAFGAVCAEIDTATLDVVGGGPLLAEYMDLVRRMRLDERISFHGFQADPEQWIYRADVLVHGASIEGFGRVVAEAAVRGRPAIVPAAGATGEIVINGTTGVTYSPADRGALASRIFEAANWSAEEWSRLGTNAREFSRAAFSMERAAAEYLILCSSLLSRRGEVQNDQCASLCRSFAGVLQQDPSLERL
jgi:glycosyltransferase involved in cell wall biosynthesis